MPAHSLVLSDFVREAESPHSVIVEGVGLVQVKDVEPDFQIGSGIAHAEEVPLGVTVRVDVILQDEVVFFIGYLDGS